MFGHAKLSKKHAIFASAALAAVALVGCDKINKGEMPDYEGARVSEDFGWWELAQGWKPDTANGFWWQPQGARQMPYDWFLHLEVADGETLFRSTENMGDKLNYIAVTAPTKRNPDALPIGFVKSEFPDENGVHWMGMTCAACHTAMMTVNGKEMVIDGGPGLGDYTAYNVQLVDALVAAWTDADKFERFATKILGAGYTEEQANKLRNDMQAQSMTMAQLNELQHSALDGGFGRVDAFGAIFNRVMAEDLAVPENRMEPDAPVSYPFLWGTPQSSVVQWNGSAPNSGAGAGPLFRNVGEVVGVNGIVKVKPARGLDFIQSGDRIDNFTERATYFGYESSANLPNIGQIEEWLQQLRSPMWPENVLPAIDREKAAQGKDLYANNCAGCHAVIARADQGETYDPVMIPVDQVGADPRMADNVMLTKNPRTGQPWQTGKLEGSRELLIFGDKHGATTDNRAGALVTLVAGIALGQPTKAMQANFKSYYAKHEAQTFDPRSYKARPLTGIWATSPYMHNGSVPNLYEMLLPEDQRSKTFHVGNREFDPVKVGYVADQPGKVNFVFDTSVDGNRNTGHNYGKDLSDEERYQIIEYLKTL